MKIRQVTYFLALCEEQSFTRAARRCGVAQPSLTRAIQLLEQEIGGRLFERSNSSVHLTELGALVYPDFVRISQSTENIERTRSRFLGIEAGYLRSEANGGVHACALNRRGDCLDPRGGLSASPGTTGHGAGVRSSERPRRPFAVRG